MHLLSFRSYMNPQKHKFDHWALSWYANKLCFVLFYLLTTENSRNLKKNVIKEANWAGGSILLLASCTPIWFCMIWNRGIKSQPTKLSTYCQVMQYTVSKTIKISYHPAILIFCGTVESFTSGFTINYSLYLTQYAKAKSNKSVRTRERCILAAPKTAKLSEVKVESLQKNYTQPHFAIN